MIEGAVAGRITVEEAASLLQLSERQVKRLKQRSSDGSGAQWVYHGNRERTPANRTAECLRQQVVSLAREKYSGFNDSHFQQKLEATEKVSVSRSTVRRILRSAGIGSPQKRRAAKYRSRRERRAQEGMMVLTDASTHDWLEDRGPRLTMVGWIDDATSLVPSARFQSEGETSAGYLATLRQLVEIKAYRWRCTATGTARFSATTITGRWPNN